MLKIKNSKVVIFALIAIVFVILAITVHWLFIIPAVILMMLNQRELMGKNKKSKNGRE